VARSLIARIPDPPTGAIDDARECRVLETDPSVLAPRPAEIYPARRGRGGGCGSNAGLVDHVVRHVGAGCASRGRDVPVAVDADVRPIDPGACVLAEDEVRGALDVAFGV